MRRAPWRWRTCVNCRVRPVAGCLCVDCLRAAVVGLVLAEGVQAAVRWLWP